MILELMQFGDLKWFLQANKLVIRNSLIESPHTMVLLFYILAISYTLFTWLNTAIFITSVSIISVVAIQT